MLKDWLIARRLALKMTQKDLAAASGLGNTYISKIENGRADPTLSTLEKIAAACQAELVLVPQDRLTEVRRLFDAPAPAANPSVGSAFADVFIPDPADQSIFEDKSAKARK